MNRGRAANGPAAWLDDLPDYLSNHALILKALVAEARQDPRLRALQVQGSVGRGSADKLSDLDLGLVVEESGWPGIADEVPSLVRRLGPVVDDHYEFLPGPDAPEVFRVWAQFQSGIQVDMLVLPTSRVLGSGPDGRTVFDPDDLLLVSDHPLRVTDPPAVSKWAFVCWHDLAESVKYIERNSPAAAIEWLGSARLATISCWAAAHGVDYAGLANVMAARLGVTCPWPDGLEKTYPTADVRSVVAAAVALAELQTRVEVLLAERLAISSRPLGGWVTEWLHRLQEDLDGPGTRRAASSRQETRTRAAHQPRPPRAARRPR